MKPLRFENGIFPVIPGIVIGLGEYGYWDNQQWCRVGNISTMPEMRRVFTEETISVEHLMEDSRGVEFSGGADGDFESRIGGGNATMTFTEKGSMYFKGFLKSERRYVSLEGEIKPFLIKLRELGLWDTKYWLAYAIFDAEDFISVRSLAKGVEAKLQLDNQIENLSGTKVGFSLNFKKDEVSVESARPGKTETAIFAGARFLSLERKNLFSKTMTIKYNSSSDSYGWESEEVGM